MPNVPVIIGIFNSVKNLLNCIILVWTKYHQTFIPFVQNNIFTYQFTKSTFIKEECGKLVQFIEWIISCISPIEGKLISAIWIIGKISSIHTIGNNEQLNIVEQSME